MGRHGDELSGVLTISGTRAQTRPYLASVEPAVGWQWRVLFYNTGLVRQTNGVTLAVGASNTRFYNLAGAIHDLEGDGNNIVYDNAGCCSGPVYFSTTACCARAAARARRCWGSRRATWRCRSTMWAGQWRWTAGRWF